MEHEKEETLSYPGHNVVIFVQWYNNLIKKINKNELQNVININFENFFENFYKEKDILSNLLEINSEKNDEFDLDRTMKNLYKYKNHLTREEMEYIDKNINEHQ